MQKLFADMESDLYKKELAEISSINEIFVTGLPRSGTTLLLEFLYQTDEFCTYSYRHMPFVLTPLLWKKLSSPFSKKSQSIERAHGDGMQVSFDSPEAFEEVIWLSYLKEQYVKPDHLEPLNLRNTSKQFAEKLKISFKKLILDAQINSGHENGKDSVIPKRYISKNNANSSRLDVLTKLFPDATILVPFREPLSHIGSLIKQHAQFCEMHKDNSFAKNYMRWLGHYDFGENFKPINFDNWLENTAKKNDYNSSSFWLEYWIAGYTHLLNKSGGNIHLIDYNKLLESPRESLSQIAEVSKLESSNEFIQNAEKVRAPTSHPSDSADLDEVLLQQATNLYSKLKAAAL
ncbi:MAG: hypothetical protein ACJARI_000746 [Bacteroidia bacterium]|jgi:hypothetical protein